MTQTRKSAIYASDKEGNKSIEVQIRTMEDYAKKNNVQVVKTYVGNSNDNILNNEAMFQEMIKDSALEISDIVIIAGLGKLFKNKYELTFCKRKLKVNDIRLISVMENLAREVMKGMKENVLEYKHLGGLPPLGYGVVIIKIM